jgi:hypothetical protein
VFLLKELMYLCRLLSQLSCGPTKSFDNSKQFPPKESDFHGPYNKLLHTFFPPDSDFTVVPQYLKASSRDVADFIVCFEIHLKNLPVLIVELKDPSAILQISTRREADDQIRRRMGDLAGHCPLPTLHAISAMGTRLCFYSVDTTDLATAEILPVPIVRHSTRVNDYAPAERWEYDVMEEGGETNLRAVIQEVLQGCAALPANE